jgi:hypothetical protein
MVLVAYGAMAGYALYLGAYLAAGLTTAATLMIGWFARQQDVPEEPLVLQGAERLLPPVSSQQVGGEAKQEQEPGLETR